MGVILCRRNETRFLEQGTVKEYNFAMVTEQTLQDLITTIVQIASPKKIILFGSYARNTMVSDSDLDLMVIVGDEELDLRLIKTNLHIAISRKIDIPCDILVERETIFHERGKLPTIEQIILLEGHTLYAA